MISLVDTIKRTKAMCRNVMTDRLFPTCLAKILEILGIVRRSESHHLTVLLVLLVMMMPVTPSILVW